VLLYLHSFAFKYRYILYRVCSGKMSFTAGNSWQQLKRWRCINCMLGVRRIVVPHHVQNISK
jgi:hypothetical protein